MLGEEGGRGSEGSGVEEKVGERGAVVSLGGGGQVVVVCEQSGVRSQQGHHLPLVAACKEPLSVGARINGDFPQQARQAHAPANPRRRAAPEGCRQIALPRPPRSDLQARGVSSSVKGCQTCDMRNWQTGFFFATIPIFFSVPHRFVFVFVCATPFSVNRTQWLHTHVRHMMNQQQKD